MTRRALSTMCLALVLLPALAACGQVPHVPPGTPSAEPSSDAGPVLTPRPIPGHEVYGFVPYWEMDAGIAAHLAATPLTTIGLFSVTTTSKGAIDIGQNGYRRITGATGRQLISEAHGRGARVELVFSSFGLERNSRLFRDAAIQDATITALVALAGELGVDGIDVDVESLDPTLTLAFGDFVGRLRAAVVAADPPDRVSVATSANITGAAMAAAASAAGADRIFVMGYDYRVAGSDPGAVAPLLRRDGEEKSLTWTLDLYADLGIPVDRTLLGLPLYGMSWPVAGPDLGAPATGKGTTWIPENSVGLLLDPMAKPLRDETEAVELYVLDGQGNPVAPTGVSPPPVGAPPPTVPVTPAAAGSPAVPMPSLAGSWRAIYVDSPQTLAIKLGLANDRGLAGAGFWAIGYERGLPAYTDVIASYAAGEPMR